MHAFHTFECFLGAARMRSVSAADRKIIFDFFDIEFLIKHQEDEQTVISNSAGQSNLHILLIIFEGFLRFSHLIDRRISLLTICILSKHFST